MMKIVNIKKTREAITIQFYANHEFSIGEQVIIVDHLIIHKESPKFFVTEVEIDAKQGMGAYLITAVTVDYQYDKSNIAAMGGISSLINHRVK